MLTLDIARDTVEESPDDQTLLRAAARALALTQTDPEKHWELSLRIVDATEMQELNGRYRGKHKPTNVLSFPANLPEEVTINLLGDIVICAPVVRREAQMQGKHLDAHWDHMLIHGVLHLLGFDHESDAEATHMESLETRAMATLGWPCPYHGEPGARTILQAEGTPG